MNSKDLQAFLHLSESLHFNRSALALHTSPSTLSRIIQRLEAEFGQSLFERDNRCVKLTSAGSRFIGFAETVVHEWQSLKNEFDSESPQIAGEISIYCTVTAAHLYLPKLIEKCRTLHPRIEIKLDTGDVSEAYQKVHERQVDFAFAVADERISDKFLFQQLHHIPFKIIAPKQIAHFSRYLQPGNIDWQHLPLVMPKSGPSAERVLAWLKKLNVKPKIYAQVSGNEAIVSMTALGCGVSAVPAPVLELSPVRDKIQVISVPFLPKPFELGMVCLRKQMVQPAISAFWQLVIESVSEN